MYSARLLLAHIRTDVIVVDTHPKTKDARKSNTSVAAVSFQPLDAFGFHAQSGIYACGGKNVYDEMQSK